MQQQPLSTEMRPGFRLKSRISDQQRAELSWLAANTEPNRRSSSLIAAPYGQSFHFTTKQPQTSLSANDINHYQKPVRYYGDQQRAEHLWLTANTKPNWRQSPIVAPNEQSLPDQISKYQQYQHYYAELPTMHQAFPPIYYTANFRTFQPTYYHNYFTTTFVPPTYLPVSKMVTAIRDILSFLQKTMYPSDNNDNDFNTIRDFSKNANLTIKKPQSSLSSALLPLSALLSSSAASSAVVAGTGKLDEMAIKSISGNKDGVETRQFVNAERSERTGIEKVNSATAVPVRTTKTMTMTTTTTTSSLDDGNNLLGSLLNGRLHKVDWFGSLLGINQLPTKEEGSALAQIFKGGIFGPGN